CVSIGNYPNSKYGYINKKGKEVIPLKYDTAWSFYQEFALVELNGKYGYIDKTGKEITPIIYDHAFVVIDGVAVVRHNNKWGIVKFLL
ncbi:MAG: WG repeat-containing protein, partial [Bacillota bacterium]|nr:WG repeat-containing protein [Bacillota bacterium]